MLPVLLDMPPSVTCAANSISVMCGESHQVCQLDNSWIPPWYLGYWRSIPGYWLSIRDTGAVSWAVQLLSRTAIELVVERQGREETREHNIDADDLRLQGAKPDTSHFAGAKPDTSQFRTRTLRRQTLSRRVCGGAGRPRGPRRPSRARFSRADPESEMERVETVETNETVTQ